MIGPFLEQKREEQPPKRERLPGGAGASAFSGAFMSMEESGICSPSCLQGKTLLPSFMFTMLCMWQKEEDSVALEVGSTRAGIFRMEEKERRHFWQGYMAERESRRPVTACFSLFVGEFG